MNRPRLDPAWTWFAIVTGTILALNAFVFDKLPFADDVYFSHALDHRSLVDFVTFRYLHWSGRIPVEAALAGLANQMVAWKVLNAAMVLLLCHAAGRIGFQDRLRAPAAAACAFALLMLFTPHVLWEGAWWVSGSFNYLWPAALGACGLLHFLDPRPRAMPARLGLMLASGLAVYNEQVALVMLALLLPLLAVRVAARTWTRWDSAHLLFVLLNMLVVFAAPGTRSRYLAEQATWFANFDTLGFGAKASLGMGLVARGMLDPGNLLVALLAAVSACFVLRAPVSRPARWVLAGGVAFIGLHFLLVLAVPPGSPLTAPYATTPISGANAAIPKAYLAQAIDMFAIATLVIAAALSVARDGRAALYAGWAMVAGLGSVMALGWSPTVFASGDRTQFIAAAVFLVIACRALAMLRAEFGDPPFRLVLLLAGLLAGLRVLQLAA